MTTLRLTSSLSSPSQQQQQGLLPLDSATTSEDNSKRKRRPFSYRTKWSVRAALLLFSLFMIVWSCVPRWLLQALQSRQARDSAASVITSTLSQFATLTERSVVTLPLNPETGQPQLDFLVAGFPKCGTTTLLYAFNKHADISIGARENCILARPLQDDITNLRQLDAALAELDGTKLRAMKCPDTLNNFKTIHRLARHSPHAKFVIGVRHPVKQLQSFYNYRVTEIYDKHLKEKIPDLLTLLQPDSVPWKNVSMDSARFELKLMQFAKTNMTIADFDLLQDRHFLAVKPNKFSIFLYALEQINDSDSARSAEFRSDLQVFLGLPTPIQQLGHENLNRFVGSKAHPETVNVCDTHFDSVRAQLVENSRRTALWIRDAFVQSDAVTVSNPDYFTTILDDWMKDPCRPTSTKLH